MVACGGAFACPRVRSTLRYRAKFSIVAARVMGAVCPSGWAMTGSSALLQAVNVNVYAAAATTYTLSLSFSWLLFVSDEKPRTAKVVRGHFNHNLFLLISRKTLIAIVFRVGLSGVRNGFPESLGCCVKRRKAIGRHGQVEERDTACIGVLGRRRIGLIWLSDIGPVRFTNRGRY